MTASPPNQSIILSAQQRELKRQREQVRREAKVAFRRQASASTPGSSPPQNHSAVPTPASGSVTGSPSSFLQSPPPAIMADLSASAATGGLPGIYGSTSSASSQMPLLSEPATTSSSLGSPSYYSSPMHDHQQSGVFSSSYQNQGYMPEYTTASFPASAPATLHSQYPRGMHDQQNLMYHMPPPSSSSMISPNHISHHQQTAHQLPLPQQLAHHQQPQHRSSHHSGLHGGPHAHQPSPPLPPHAHAHDSASGPHQYEGGMAGNTVGSTGPAGVRVVQSRPKPQCWEHGCNGRQFSTFSNLLRHQREKSGQATKAVCPNCGAEFTRTTARNGHLQHDKCKQRRSG
ncbi:uncharacterized protein SPSK_00837 [Sporothrix schenckii 1099-18]|uniref:C2H2-type domain-containing protein n=2 Tax=Sporothrix schenckii TaxID=29908 RepID=U7PM87_SPOS1|nr:uncharacterized protein SPSK_00837 [Sporothrix schenckii 1099-18]ERS96031.1 hypothetical protein HMPREF1624_07567 [Sporothrix schenckii ATCC 58251]KJR81703.1 hypothetical protein SPSK_00837 [Sporothrix schenckii 1099-18]